MAKSDKVRSILDRHFESYSIKRMTGVRNTSVIFESKGENYFLKITDEKSMEADITERFLGSGAIFRKGNDYFIRPLRKGKFIFEVSKENLDAAFFSAGKELARFHKLHDGHEVMCHGDFGLVNVLVSEKNEAIIIDFEKAYIGAAHDDLITFDIFSRKHGFTKHLDSFYKGYGSGRAIPAGYFENKDVIRYEKLESLLREQMELEPSSRMEKFCEFLKLELEISKE